jgi:hypothetical protein
MKGLTVIQVLYSETDSSERLWVEEDVVVDTGLDYLSPITKEPVYTDVYTRPLWEADVLDIQEHVQPMFISLEELSEEELSRII